MGLPHSQKEKWIRPAVHMRTTQRELHAAWSKKIHKAQKSETRQGGTRKRQLKKEVRGRGRPGQRGGRKKRASARNSEGSAKIRGGTTGAKT